MPVLPLVGSDDGIRLQNAAFLRVVQHGQRPVLHAACGIEISSFASSAQAVLLFVVGSSEAVFADELVMVAFSP